MKKAAMITILWISLLFSYLFSNNIILFSRDLNSNKNPADEVYVNSVIRQMNAYRLMPPTPDLSPAPIPEPTVTQAPNSIPTGTPEPTAILTPVPEPTGIPTPDLTAAPTSIPAPTSTPIPTPEPVPTLSEIVTGSMTAETLERSNLAYQILNNSRITLAVSHPSGVRDNAFAYDNIYYTYLGYEAQRSDYQNAPGGSVYLSSTMMNVILILAEKYTFTITEIAGASHSKSSKHYEGIAFDVGLINGRYATNNSISRAFVADAKKYGATYTLIERTCIHIDFR